MIFTLEIPQYGALADLLWSDPDPDVKNFSLSPRFVVLISSYMRGLNLKSELDKLFFFFRGVGYTFGDQAVRNFLFLSGLSHICRSHQLCMEGYTQLFDGKLSTIWSAPNYCFSFGNKASILQIDSNEAFHFVPFSSSSATESKPDCPSDVCKDMSVDVSIFCTLHSKRHCGLTFSH